MSETATISIRPEREEDHEGVFRVVSAAFGQDDEARAVDELRKLAIPQVSLVADTGTEIMGHVMFSPVTIGSGRDLSRAMGLAPLAIAPAYQNRGIGSQLARAGLAACRDLNEAVVVVLGHRDYYPRFGFRPAHGYGLYYRAPGLNPSFMVVELQPGALAGRKGEVHYLPPLEPL
jgi:putative acetyltransferase